jgi:hypothetical protein
MGLLAFLRAHREAIQASVSPSGAPQAAIVGVAFSDELEVVFDTLESTRKAHNLRANPRIALVIGSGERTVQVEGIADEPTGAELERVRELYFAVYPDGRDRLRDWPGLIHVRVRPTWIRDSDFSVAPPRIVEQSFVK